MLQRTVERIDAEEEDDRFREVTCPTATGAGPVLLEDFNSGERIVSIRTLVTSTKGSETGRSIDTVANTGQYL